jgi:hypothetical protein
MINFVLNNFQGCLGFQSVNSVQLSEVNVSSSAVTPEFFGGVSTNQGFCFFSDIARNNSPSPNFAFTNILVPSNTGKILKYVASSVYYFYYYSGHNLSIFNANTPGITALETMPSNIIAIDLTGSIFYLADGGGIHRYTIGAAGALTANGFFRFNNVLSLCALDANNVLVGLKSGGYARFNFSTGASTVINNGYFFQELSLCGSYIVGTNNLSLWVEATASLFTGIEVITPLTSFNIPPGGNIIRCLNNSVSGSVLFHTGNGIATVTLSTSLLSNFIYQNSIGNQYINGLSFFDVTSDGVSYLLGNGILSIIYKLHEKIYTYSSTQVYSQPIYRALQGRLKINAMFPNASSATATVNILDENQIPLMSWAVASGVVTTAGAIGEGTSYCYFDAPLGLTNQSFQYQITSSSNEIVNVYLEEVQE